jgi:sialate O-acetylesterase
MHRRPLDRRALLATFALPLVLGPAAVPAQQPAPSTGLRLASIFSDGLVLQQQAVVPVWGWADPGEPVTVTFRGVTRSTRSDSAGGWEVALPEQAPGGPFEMTVAAGGATVTLRDVRVGDVWVASGQSNMEFPLSRAETGPREAAAANDPALRQFLVQHGYSPDPLQDVRGGPWYPADADHAGDFTAVGYYFGKALRGALDIPIGLLHTSWGGANIESWTSREAQGLDVAAMDSIVRADSLAAAAMRDGLRQRLGRLPAVDSGLVAGGAVWAAPELDDGDWASLRVPGPWEAEYPGLDGVAWYRTMFELTAAEAAGPARVLLGTIDDDDIAWINGVEVGRTSGYDIPRAYPVSASVLRPGRNVLTVRVTDGGGEGGVIGRSGPVALEVGTEQRPLSGPWRFRVGRVEMSPDGQRINKIPAYLYNAMVHPLLRFPIRGVIWYQGESNANTEAQATAYRRQMRQLITSWRDEWRGGRGERQAFPFLWVQLPNYGPVDSIPPARATWATLRESQEAALSLPNTGQAVAIDLGDPNDIHPVNKADVGARLARVALALAYGREVEAYGPTYGRHSISDGQVIVEFDHAPGGLVSDTPDGRVAGFAIAGPDRRFVRAEARIDGDRVRVWSDRVPDPVAVRYAWSNSPAGLSLYNRSGLPAAPFRTDDW